jgi:hypothetical protein
VSIKKELSCKTPPDPWIVVMDEGRGKTVNQPVEKDIRERLQVVFLFFCGIDVECTHPPWREGGRSPGQQHRTTNTTR